MQIDRGLLSLRAPQLGAPQLGAPRPTLELLGFRGAKGLRPQTSGLCHSRWVNGCQLLAIAALDKLVVDKQPQWLGP